MLTIHAAALLLTGTGAEAVPDGAVAVAGDRIASVGPYASVAEAHPGARVRHWPGALTPGLRHPRAAAVLEAAYHPDPREADALGDRPLTGAALAALAMDDTRWGASARRGLQRMLRCGVTALTGPFEHPAVRTAVARSGLRVLPYARVPGAAAEPAAAADPDPLTVLAPGAAADPLFTATLAPGARADLAVFTALPAAGGAAHCLATVLAGRLVFRGR